MTDEPIEQCESNLDPTSERPNSPDADATMEVLHQASEAALVTAVSETPSAGPPPSRDEVTAGLMRVAERKRQELAQLEETIRQQSHTEYPQVLYHQTHGAKTVLSPDERNALGAGWLDHPVE